MEAAMQSRPFTNVNIRTAARGSPRQKTAIIATGAVVSVALKVANNRWGVQQETHERPMPIPAVMRQAGLRASEENERKIRTMVAEAQRDMHRLSAGHELKLGIRFTEDRNGELHLHKLPGLQQVAADSGTDRAGPDWLIGFLADNYECCKCENPKADCTYEEICALSALCDENEEVAVRSCRASLDAQCEVDA